MADSGALMTTARLTVTWEGKPNATAAKMPARHAVPRTNRVIGRIAFPPYQPQLTAARPSAPAREQTPRFPKENDYSPLVNKGAANESISTDRIGLYRVGDLVGFGRDRPLLANSLHHRAWILGRSDRLFDPGVRQFVPGPLARAGGAPLPHAAVQVRGAGRLRLRLAAEHKHGAERDQSEPSPLDQAERLAEIDRGEARKHDKR